MATLFIRRQEIPGWGQTGCSRIQGNPRRKSHALEPGEGESCSKRITSLIILAKYPCHPPWQNVPDLAKINGHPCRYLDVEIWTLENAWLQWKTKVVLQVSTEVVNCYATFIFDQLSVSLSVFNIKRLVSPTLWLKCHDACKIHAGYCNGQQ